MRQSRLVSDPTGDRTDDDGERNGAAGTTRDDRDTMQAVGVTARRRPPMVPLDPVRTRSPRPGPRGPRWPEPRRLRRQPGRPRRRPTPRRPRCQTVRGGEDQPVGLVGPVPDGPLAGGGSVIAGPRPLVRAGHCPSWGLPGPGPAHRRHGIRQEPDGRSPGRLRARRPGVRPRHAGFAARRSRDRLVPRG